MQQNLEKHEYFGLHNFMADISTSCFLAWKSIIKGNRAILILTPIIIGFSIANLVFSSSLFSGMIRGLNDQLINNLFGHILIEPSLDRNYFASVQNLERSIREISGVASVTSHFKTSGKFVFDKDKDNMKINTAEYPIVGINPETEFNVTKISESIIAGRYLEDHDRDNILIGAEIAGGGLGSFEKISLGGVRVGDEIMISFPNNLSKEYKVIGIYKTGVDGIDNMAFLNQKEIGSVMDTIGYANEVLVRLEDPQNIEPTIENIKVLTPLNSRISSWDTLSSFTATLSSSFKILDIINGSVSLIVACATIFIVTFINVINKRRQLGILKAIGVRESIIIRSYILQTLFFGILGTVIGLMIVFCVADLYFSNYPLDMGFARVGLHIQTIPTIINVVVIILAGAFAGFLPAWITVRQSIIKAIWG